MNATKLEPVTSGIFNLETINFSTGPSEEQILRGGRKLFGLLPKAFEGVHQICVVGWGSQAPAQAQNLRDSLAAAGITDIVVKVALRAGSKSFDKARAVGFQVSCDPGEGTVGFIDDIVPSSDMVLLLVADGAAAKIWKEVTEMMKPGSTLGLSHGFLIGYLKSAEEKIRDDINIVLMAPKGMGNSVRRLYLQGASTDGAGINSSVAVYQDVNGKALDQALGWAVGTGSPVTFFTTMEKEVVSDLTGERAILLGAVWALSEVMYRYFRKEEFPPDKAFLLSAKGLTSTIVSRISEKGLLGAYESLDENCQEAFQAGYCSVYEPAREVISRIYANVSSWAEITEVIEATEALKKEPMSQLESSEMWKVGEKLYGKEVPMSEPLAFVMGFYVGTMMAQLDTLVESGHAVSEVVNESVIEATDSLMPFMDKKGVSYMVDNCSTTARLGTRKWGPEFEEAFTRALGEGNVTGDGCFEAFLNSPLHADIQTCLGLRPSVRIALD